MWVGQGGSKETSPERDRRFVLKGGSSCGSDGASASGRMAAGLAVHYIKRRERDEGRHLWSQACFVPIMFVSGGWYCYASHLIIIFHTN